ncbi:MAG: hypothetical protein RML94_00900, partial [Bacteroidia bacterium]|nr:hypothetical protein [Bacteroidia bacterium]
PLARSTPTLWAYAQRNAHKDTPKKLLSLSYSSVNTYFKPLSTIFVQTFIHPIDEKNKTNLRMLSCTFLLRHKSKVMAYQTFHCYTTPHTLSKNYPPFSISNSRCVSCFYFTLFYLRPKLLKNAPLS